MGSWRAKRGILQCRVWCVSVECGGVKYGAWSAKYAAGSE